MSFPQSDPETCDDSAEPPCVERFAAKEATVGELTVRRSLPTRARRMVGPWCFADHMGPATVTTAQGIDVGPHPHMGLHTVTWLLDGEVLHRDSLGSEQMIRPGQLNLMTAGAGVAHSEESTGTYAGVLEGIQLWLAQPDSVRFGDAAFRHHETLPAVDVGQATVTALVGSVAGVEGARTEHGDGVVGADLAVRGPAEIPLAPAHEYGLVVLRGGVRVEGADATPGALWYLGQGRDSISLDRLRIDGAGSSEPARVMLLGGTPFEAQLLMWWNFVGRTWDEITQAVHQWNTHHERFGEVASTLARYTAPEPPVSRTTGRP